jgi:Proteolysis_6 C-terminal
MSKLLLSIQAFTYSCCSEAFEAKRAYQKCTLAASEVAKKSPDSSSIESILTRFGLKGLACRGKMILMPQPSPHEDSDSWPFSGRLGKLRYLGLAVMAASGAVAADLVQLVLPFPAVEHEVDLAGVAIENPKRAPITYPLLFSNILTHVVAAICSTCGRARARSDLLDVVWPIPFSIRGSFAFLDLGGNSKTVDSVVQDCEGFLKLGLVARMLQVMLGTVCGASNMRELSSSWIDAMKKILATADDKSTVSIDVGWMKSCVKLLEVAVSSQIMKSIASESAVPLNLSLELLQEACTMAALAAGSFLIEAGTIYQILVPGAVTRYDNDPVNETSMEINGSTPLVSLQEALTFFRFESVDEMIDSELVEEIVVYWFDTALDHTRMSVGPDEASTALLSRLYRTQGFRVYDWPSAKPLDYNMDTIIREWSDKDLDKARLRMQPKDEAVAASNLLPVESLESRNTPASTADIVRSEVSPSLLTFQSKKCVSLLGGFSPDHFMNSSKLNARPRVCVIPTSYTDLYAELASLLPDCEQTAVGVGFSLHLYTSAILSLIFLLYLQVCLICGEVLNAGGRGECTRHSFKCGAGAGIFFLLQECSGLILHKARAAYIHSPYVDSHGETPQYRGRPLNLDLDRYEHLREVWFSHGVRQKVLTERAMARQVILPDFY